MKDRKTADKAGQGREKKTRSFAIFWILLLTSYIRLTRDRYGSGGFVNCPDHIAGCVAP